MSEEKARKHGFCKVEFEISRHLNLASYLKKIAPLLPVPEKLLYRTTLFFKIENSCGKGHELHVADANALHQNTKKRNHARSGYYESCIERFHFLADTALIKKTNTNGVVMLSVPKANVSKPDNIFILSSSQKRI